MSMVLSDERLDDFLAVAKLLRANDPHPSLTCADVTTLIAEVKAARAGKGVGARLAAEDVEWVVNDIAELGVKIGNQFFFCYKGRSLVYDEPTHEESDPRVGYVEGDQMHWRPVFKREFGKAGWRDIVSDPPPKDGTFVLLYNVAHGAQAVMGWTADVGMPDIFPDGCWTDAGSRNQAINLTVNCGYFQYWQPLPTPPSIPGDGR